MQIGNELIDRGEFDRNFQFTEPETKISIDDLDLVYNGIIYTYLKVSKIFPQHQRDYCLHNDYQTEINSILLTGCLGNGRVFDQYPGKNGSTLTIRQNLLKIYLNNPELAKAIVELEIVGTHGSSIGSLISVLDNGILPTNKLVELNIPVSTGEHQNGYLWNQEFVSMIEWTFAGTTRMYATDRPQSRRTLRRDILDIQTKLAKGDQGSLTPGLELRRNFLLATLKLLSEDSNSIEARLIRDGSAVVYFVSKEGIEGKKVEIPRSDINSEYGIQDGIAQQYIKIILVPKNRIEFTKRILANKGREDIQVFALESYSTDYPDERPSPLLGMTITQKIRWYMRSMKRW